MELRSTDQINMIPLPFYEVHTTLIQGLPVNCSDLGDVRNRIPQFRRIAFTLSIDHANLCSSTTSNRGHYTERPYHILLRLGRMPTDSNQEIVDEFPPLCEVTLNSKEASTLPPSQPSHHANIDAKRPGRSVNLTPECYLSPYVPNVLTIQWQPDSQNLSYCASLYFARRFSVEELLQQIRDRERLSARSSLDLVRRLLEPGPKSSDLHIHELIVHFRDLVLRRRISTPVRATTCEHALCFDAEAYLQMEDRNPKWLCPVCGKPIRFENIRIDLLFVDLLARFPNDDEFRFTADTLVREEGRLLCQSYAKLVNEQRAREPLHQSPNPQQSSIVVPKRPPPPPTARLPSIPSNERQRKPQPHSMDSGSDSDDSVTAPAATAERRRRHVPPSGKSRILSRIVGNNSVLRTQLHVASGIQSRLHQQLLQPQQPPEAPPAATPVPQAPIPIALAAGGAHFSASAPASNSNSATLSQFSDVPSVAQCATSPNGVSFSFVNSEESAMIKPLQMSASDASNANASAEHLTSIASSSSLAVPAPISSLERHDSVINISSDDDENDL